MTIIKALKKLLRLHREKTPPIHAKFIVPRQSHTISKHDLSENVLKILNRLISSGFQAYLVGGSVRDMLLSKKPKDFDVATNATPQEVRKIFNNARIIGRRFKIVHVVFQRDIIEVATFRGNDPSHHERHLSDEGMLLSDNVYGTIEEDAFRRDFTINSLYYSLEDASIIDFTAGFKDIQNKMIRLIGDPVTRYQEDPVRILRAIRFSAKLNFHIHPDTEKPIQDSVQLLQNISSGRLFDELTKMFQCGSSVSVYEMLKKYNILSILSPSFFALSKLKPHPIESFLQLGLHSTDDRIADGKTITPAFIFAILLWHPFNHQMNYLIENESLLPIDALQKAMSKTLSDQCKITAIPKRFTQAIQEIWLLQFRFSKRIGKKPYLIIQHPRYRAAYDFLHIRSLIKEVPLDLVKWWDKFYLSNDEKREIMIKQLSNTNPSKRKKKKKPSVETKS
jgi:poly(A) polymerase